MTFADWLTMSRQAVQQDGLAGLRAAVGELYWGGRERLRRLHVLTPNTRVVEIDGVSVAIEQRTVAEWDAIRAIHNERWLARRLLTDVQRGDVVWDVGGNIGFYAMLAAAAGARVVSFEPWLENAATIERNVRRNGLEQRVRVVPKALADTTGTSEFVLDERAAPGGGRGSLNPEWQDGATRDVETIRAQDAVDGTLGLPTPGVVKIDVEGAEQRVLDGFGDRLKDVRVAYCELHGFEDDAVRRHLRRDGFEVTHDAADSGCGVLRAELEDTEP